MFRSRLIYALLFSTLSFSAFAVAESVIVVNGVAIDKKDIDQMTNTIIENSQAKDTPTLRENVKNMLINRELILQEAKRRHLDKDPDVIRRLDEARNEILSTALFSDIVKQTPITEAQIKARYEEWANKRKGQKEVHAQQIVVTSEAEAKKLIADLNASLKKNGSAKKGTAKEDMFATLAKTYSIDPNAKQTGGDMGWGNLSDMDPTLANTLKELAVGQFTQTPFQAGNTWHIFKVEGIRDAKVPELDQIKGQITQQLQEELIAKTVAELRAKATIK